LWSVIPENGFAFAGLGTFAECEGATSLSVVPDILFAGVVAVLMDHLSCTIIVLRVIGKLATELAPRPLGCVVDDGDMELFDDFVDYDISRWIRHLCSNPR